MIISLRSLLSALALLRFGSAQYSEELSITPLPNGHLHTNFHFDLTSPPFAASSLLLISNFNVFPNLLANLLSQTGTESLSIRFTSGYWNPESWGKLPANGLTSGGNGLELWATIRASSQAEAFEKWRFLANLLSGFFCASINFVDESITTFPEYAFKSGDLPEGVFLLKALLPREPICTENLTPIIKLLPTKGKAGILSLLDGHRLFDSKWVATAIDVTSKQEGNQVLYNLSIDLNNAFHVPTILEKLKSPLPKPIPGDDLTCDYDKRYDLYHCFPLSDYANEIKFSLESIFQRKIRIDDIIGSSKVCAHVDRSNPDLLWKLNALLSSEDFATGHFLYANRDLQNDCYELKNKPEKKEDLDIQLHLQGSYKDVSLRPEDYPDVHVTRSITGYELDKGGFRITFKNPTDSPVDLVYLESLPWYLRIYLHKLRVIKKQGSLKPQEIPELEVIRNILYTTAIDRKRPAKIEVLMRIPADTSITVTYSFDKSLLLYSEYPPDANHGFELDPAVVTLIKEENGQIVPYYTLRTTTLLVLLPTPDFSMPYNVIILTSTIMALIFGTVFNFLVKRVISEEEYEQLLATGQQSGPLVRAILRFRSSRDQFMASIGGKLILTVKRLQKEKKE